jgi:hypothetical protein
MSLITPTPSNTPSNTPTITPSNTSCPVLPSPTPSVTPTITPTNLDCNCYVYQFTVLESGFVCYTLCEDEIGNCEFFSEGPTVYISGCIKANSLSGNIDILSVSEPCGTWCISPSRPPLESPTQTPTQTGTPTQTPTNTGTPTGTPTQTPTPTPTPESSICVVDFGASMISCFGGVNDEYMTGFVTIDTVTPVDADFELEVSYIAGTTTGDCSSPSLRFQTLFITILAGNSSGTLTCTDAPFIDFDGATICNTTFISGDYPLCIF